MEIGPNLVSQLPAVGERFVWELLIRGGRRQAFSEARRFCEAGGERKLAAIAGAVLLTVSTKSEDGPDQRPPRATR